MADIPVDLYFILDFTKTMVQNGHIGNLEKSADDISAKIGDLTQDFKIGFGSFSDKPTVPFSSKKQANAKNERRPYAFHNHMSLMKNATGKFKEEIKKKIENIQENLDNPESG